MLDEHNNKHTEAFSSSSLSDSAVLSLALHLFLYAEIKHSLAFLKPGHTTKPQSRYIFDDTNHTFK